MVLNSDQEEELEVLKSIFEGDEAFKVIKDNEIQYKVGEDGSVKSFLLTIKWPEEYPTCKPEINMDSFYNKHLIDSVKENIITLAYEQAEGMLGEPVTYTVIDWAKENAESLMADQQETTAKIPEKSTESKDSKEVPKKKEKKEQLTKAQKRKLADRVDASGSRPRGWDWVDVVRHLSQTGGKNDDN